MKLLFTSVGRRVELIEQFHKAADELNIDLSIIGADISEIAPALYFCDKKVHVPRISDPSYINTLLDICKREKVDCLIPTIDTDLLLLSENRKAFEDIGCKVLIAFPDKIKICRDKNLTSDYFTSLGLISPFTTNSIPEYLEKFKTISPFPAFIKPKDGSSSINAFKVDKLEELVKRASEIKDFIVQPFVQGEEFTVDVFCDFEGNPIYITPRKRILTRAGEVLQTEISFEKEAIDEILTLVKDFSPRGPITVQFIKSKENIKNYYLEINPRFGGGAPLSMKAGADSAKALLRLLRGEKVSYNPNAARVGEIYSRFDNSICIKNGKRIN